MGPCSSSNSNNKKTNTQPLSLPQDNNHQGIPRESQAGLHLSSQDHHLAFVPQPEIKISNVNEQNLNQKGHQEEEEEKQGLLQNKCDTLKLSTVTVNTKQKKQQAFGFEDYCINLAKQEKIIEFVSDQVCVDYVLLEALDQFEEKLLFKKSGEDFLNFCKSQEEYDSSAFFKPCSEFIENSQFSKIQSSVIKWYTTDYFFKDLITSTFREFNFVKLFNLRFIINQLNKALNQIQLNEVTALYHVITLEQNEFEDFKSYTGKTFLLRDFTVLKTKDERKGFSNKGYEIILKIIVDPENYNKIHMIGTTEYLLSNNIFITVNCIELRNPKKIEAICTIPIVEVCKQILNSSAKELELRLQEISRKKNQNDALILVDILSFLGKHDQCIPVLEQQPDDDELTWEKFRALGHIYKALGDFKTARDFYNKAEENIEEHFGNASNEMFSIKTAHGELSLCQGNQEYLMAQSYFKLAFNIVNEQRSPEEATCYDNMGRLNFLAGNYNQAFDFYDKCLQIFLELYGKKNLDTARTYYCIAQVYFARKEYNNAVENYDQALQIYISLVGECHPICANCYSYKGLSYYHQRDKVNALKYLETSLGIFKKTLGEHHPSAYVLKKNIILLKK